MADYRSAARELKAPFRIDERQVRRAWQLFMEPGQVTELRALNARVAGEYRSGTFSGYFDNVDAFVDALQQLQFASAAYFMPNPVDQALLARSYNRARIIKDRQLTTSDRDITRRRWLLIDADPKRPAGVSATEAERLAAHELITDIDYELWERGFPAGVVCDSGNGYHLAIPAELPANDRGVCQRFLKDIAERWNNDAAVVDISVFNPARIWKLPGTLVCKGDHCPELGREWRMSRIIQECKEAEHGSV